MTSSATEQVRELPEDVGGVLVELEEAARRALARLLELGDWRGIEVAELREVLDRLPGGGPVPDAVVA